MRDRVAQRLNLAGFETFRSIHGPRETAVADEWNAKLDGAVPLPLGAVAWPLISQFQVTTDPSS